MKYLSLFSGIGAFESAMKNLNIPFDLVGFSEIDKYAVKSYCAIQNVSNSLNLGDITKIDETKLPEVDFITYGFPCQDISLAGKQQGLFNEDGSKTRSGLFFDALRIIEHTQPMVAIAENVKNLTGKKFAEQFKIVLESLESAGYNNYWKVLNAKDYGIPQNRERVFIISIRKDVDTGIFEFPEPYPLKLRLKDMLEDVVDEKFYLSEKMFNYVFNMIKEHKGIGFSDGVDSSYINPTVANTIGCRSAEGQRSGTTNYVSNDFDDSLQVKEMKNIILGGMQKNQSVKTDGVCTCLTSSMGTGGGYVPMVTEPIRLGNIYGEQHGTGHAGNVWDKNAIAPALMTMQGGNRQPLIVDNPKVVKVGNVNPSGKGQNGQVVDSEGIARTITQEKGEGQKILVYEHKEIEVFDYYNKRQIDSDVCGTITTGCSRNASGTFLVREPKIKVIGNIYPSGSQNGNIYDSEGISPTLLSGETSTKGNGGIGSSNAPKVANDLRIRKLTPKECFRLMGFDDVDFEKAKYYTEQEVSTLKLRSSKKYKDLPLNEKIERTSDTQLYKQAGNSIVVDVAEELLCMLFDEDGNFFI